MASSKVVIRFSSRLQAIAPKLCRNSLFPELSSPKVNSRASLFDSATRIGRTSRLPVELSSQESLMPLHSAIASARLISSLTIESQSWGLVPQGSNAALGPSTFTYRSLFADIIQPQDLKELCSVLVVLSSETAKTLADQRNAAERGADNQIETFLASSTHDRLQNEKDSAEKAINGDCLSANQDNIIKPDNSNSREANVPKGRPMSPGTLALMCDEEDTMFIQSAFPNGIVGNSCSTSSQMPYEQDMSEVYAEQERTVLTKFRDCLNSLITFGKIKETKCSFQARNEIGNHKDQLCNGSTISQTEGRSQRQHERVIINGTGTITAQTSPTAHSSTVIPPDDLRPKIQSLPENGESKQKGEKQV